MSRQQARNLELIDKGRMALAVKAAAMDMIEDMMRVKVEQLISTYRNHLVGDPPFAQIYGKVAELTALSDLVREIEAAEERAEHAMAKEIANAPQD
jgi:hypothetical protein